LLAAEGPTDFANRASDLTAVTSRSAHVVELVHALPGEIHALETRLAEASVERRNTRDEATELARARSRLAAKLSEAAEEVPLLQDAVENAIADAQAAIPEDQAQAVQRGQESSRLATEIVSASQALEGRGGVVEGTGTFDRPATGAVTSDYGWRYHPILGYWKFHTGVDFDGADGVVYAADRGVVLRLVHRPTPALRGPPGRCPGRPPAVPLAPDRLHGAQRVVAVDRVPLRKPGQPQQRSIMPAKLIMCSAW
jgi:murein DD-endopeptidase MepM/ murein hydrolase activator NlpD